MILTLFVFWYLALMIVFLYTLLNMAKELE
jgi:hypothetical protein